MSALDDFMESERVRCQTTLIPCEIPWLDREYDFKCNWGKYHNKQDCERCWLKAKKKKEKKVKKDNEV
jgi:hypothetical protein